MRTRGQGSRAREPIISQPSLAKEKTKWWKRGLWLLSGALNLLLAWLALYPRVSLGPNNDLIRQFGVGMTFQVVNLSPYYLREVLAITYADSLIYEDHRVYRDGPRYSPIALELPPDSPVDVLPHGIRIRPQKILNAGSISIKLEYKIPILPTTFSKVYHFVVNINPDGSAKWMRPPG